MDISKRYRHLQHNKRAAAARAIKKLYKKDAREHLCDQIMVCCAYVCTYIVICMHVLQVVLWDFFKFSSVSLPTCLPAIRSRCMEPDFFEDIIYSTTNLLFQCPPFILHYFLMANYSWETFRGVVGILIVHTYVFF